jgi:predicted dithiol-disulfide oxidoreductase (DUF899 family)
MIRDHPAREATPMTQHSKGTREELLGARKELLEREKALTRQSDELARQRRALPWVLVEKAYVFETNQGRKTLAEPPLMALSAFALEDGVVYHRYSCYDRGTDVLHLTWQLLDRAPKGRDEGASEGWPRRHDEYETAPTPDGPPPASSRGE